MSVAQVLKLFYHPRDAKTGALVFDHWRAAGEDPRERHKAACLYAGITDPPLIDRLWRDQFRGDRYVPPLNLPEDWADGG